MAKQRPYTARVLIQTDNGEPETVVLQVAGAWVGDQLLEDLQSDLDETSIFDDVPVLDAVYQVDFDFSLSPHDNYETGESFNVLEFEYDEPRLEGVPPWMVLIDHDTLQLLIGALSALTESCSIHDDGLRNAMDKASHLIDVCKKRMDKHLT